MNKLGHYEDSEYPTDINEFNQLEELMKVFRNYARRINDIDELTSPIEILNRFNYLRHTLSILQDELIKQSLDALKVKENN